MGINIGDVRAQELFTKCLRENGVDILMLLVGLFDDTMPGAEEKNEHA
jgi:hypothetical protein